MCLTWDVLFSRIPAKGWQAQKGRGWHHSLPSLATHGIPHQMPVLGMTQISELGLAGPNAFLDFFFSFFLLCVFSSLLKSCSAIKLKKCSKCLCQNVCPCSQWQQLNCWLIGGHTTWGTVSFLWQMEGPWSRRRPTAGSLEQMFCRQCKACVSSCQTPCSLMQRGAESPALQISRRNLPPELVYQLLTIQPHRT